MSTYSTYYTIMSMIDGFKSFINLAVMVLTIVASWDYVCKGRRARLGGHCTVLQLICKIQDCRETEAVLGISCGKYRKYSRMYFINV